MELDPRAPALISLVSRVRHASGDWIAGQLAAREVPGFSPSWGHILTALFFQGGRLTFGDLTRLTHRTKSTVSQLVDGLAAAGYVERLKDPDDARVVLVALTDRGRGLQRLWGEVSADLNGRAWAGFSPEESTLLLDFLERVEANFRGPRA